MNSRSTDCEADALTTTPLLFFLVFDINLHQQQQSHFSVSPPKTLFSSSREYLFELRRTFLPEESNSFFCSHLNFNKFLAAAANLSSSIIIGPDRVAYPLPKLLAYPTCIFLYTSSIKKNFYLHTIHLEKFLFHSR